MIERKPTPYDDRIYSPDWRAWRDPEIPEWLSPIDLLLGTGRGGDVAIIADGEPVTYDALRALVRRTCGGLRDAGLRPGERILLFGTDSLDYVAVWLASVRIGAVPAVVSDLYKTSDLGYFLTDTGAAALFVDAEQTGKLDELGDRLPESLATIIVRGDAPAAADRAGRRIVSLAALVAKADEVAEGTTRHSDDVCYMFYSGGTTGTAKGITHLAHDFLLIPARQGAFWEYAGDDVVYATSRKYFTHGLWPGVLIPLAFGATVVLDRRGPSPEVIGELVSRHRVTKLITVPTIIKNLIQHARVQGEARGERPDYGSVRLLVSASEKIPPEIFDTFRDLYGLEILDSIGSSEITYEWIANRPAESKRGSLGKPVFGYEIRLVDHAGEDVTGPNLPGEAWVKSRTACFFYWRKYDKSRETFIGPWTRTGDNLMFDEDGFFWFAGRDNDIFKVKGLWVSPIEIEAALTRHDAVHEAAVVSFEDADQLTKPRAFVVLADPGRAADPALVEELKAAVKPLGGYKVPEEIVFVESLPRTTLMKIDRRALRERPPV